jgi:hypothetical protein
MVQPSGAFNCPCIGAVWAFEKVYRPGRAVSQRLRFLQLVLFAALGFIIWQTAVPWMRFFFLFGRPVGFSCFFRNGIYLVRCLCNLQNEGVLVPGALGQRQLSWSNLADVAVRPDYITLFKNDNHFLQFEVAQATGKEELEELALILQTTAPVAGSCRSK